MPKPRSNDAGSITLPGGWRLNGKNMVPRKHVLNRVTAFLCSYPKCGRTWLRFMLSNYINLALDLGVDVDLNSMFTLVPNDGMKVSKNGVQSFSYVRETRVPLVLASHRPYRARAFGDRPLIALLRSPNDVAWSRYSERVRKGLIDPQVTPLSQFLVAGKGNLHEYCQYINGWAEALPRHTSLIVTFNELKADAPAALSRIAAFLNLPVIDSHLHQAVELSSLARMRALEESRGLGDRQRTPARVRSGQIGEHTKSFSAQDLANAADIYRSELSPDAKALLRNLNLLEA